MSPAEDGMSPENADKIVKGVDRLNAIDDKKEQIMRNVYEEFPDASARDILDDGRKQAVPLTEEGHQITRDMYNMRGVDAETLIDERDQLKDNFREIDNVVDEKGEPTPTVLDDLVDRTRKNLEEAAEKHDQGKAV